MHSATPPSRVNHQRSRDPVSGSSPLGASAAQVAWRASPRELSAREVPQDVRHLPGAKTQQRRLLLVGIHERLVLCHLGAVRLKLAPVLLDEVVLQCVHDQVEALVELGSACLLMATDRPLSA